MNYQEIKDKQQEFVLGTYAPKTLLVKGEGSYVWDDQDNKYLDLCVGISVCNLGHCHPKVADAVSAQSRRLWHVSNLYMNELQPQLAEKISKASFGGRVFFSNSGAESNEGLIKFARKWGSDKGRHEIIAMDDSFHGRTLAALAATGRSQYRVGFGPDLQGFKHVPFNDLEAVKAAITDQTAAVLVEPLQGEGGVKPADQAYLEGLRELCDKEGILLMFDEVQTGIGRTGEMFAYQTYGVIPDAMSMAKALGNGMPMGAFTVQQQYEGLLVPGTHATTFGGTPLACSAALAVFEAFEEENILANVKERSAQFETFAKSLVEKYDFVSDARVLGLFIGIDVEKTPADFVVKAFEKGLIILTAGTKTLRLLPALNITEDEVNEAITILTEVFEEIANA